MDDCLIKPSEAAKQLRVSHKTILLWIHNGTLPAMRVGSKCYRIKPDDLAALAVEVKAKEASA